MAAIALVWQTITPSSSPRFLIKGTEIARAPVPGTLSRFYVYEVRALNHDPVSGRAYSAVTYCIRDAAGVTDAEVREGKRPPIVWRGDDFEAGIAWAQAKAAG